MKIWWLNGGTGFTVVPAHSGLRATLWSSPESTIICGITEATFLLHRAAVGVVRHRVLRMTHLHGGKNQHLTISIFQESPSRASSILPLDFPWNRNRSMSQNNSFLWNITVKQEVRVYSARQQMGYLSCSSFGLVPNQCDKSFRSFHITQV